MKQVHRKLCKEVTLIVLVLYMHLGSFGQSNYLSAFGTTGCITDQNINRISCNALPGSIIPTASHDIMDNWATSTSNLDYVNFYKNSIYDNSGHLLFSVNTNGVYAPNGTQRYIFASNDDSAVTVTPVGGTEIRVVPGRALSEIVIFPVPNACYKYYAVFWSDDADDNKYELRVITIAIDKNTFPDENSITCKSDIMVDIYNPMIKYSIGDHTTTCPFKLLISADEKNPDGTRDIYTLEPDRDSMASYMRRWTIGANGEIPTSPYTYFDHITPSSYGRMQTNAYGEKSKILKIEGRKYFSYVGGPTGQDFASSGPKLGFALSMFSLDSAKSPYLTPSLATAILPSVWNPVMPWDETQIYGFEYVPALNKIYFTYGHFPSTSAGPTSGGIGYWDSAGNVVLSSTSTDDFRFSDLEITKKGDLLLVNGTNAATTNGKLAYLNVSDPGFTPSATITPTVITTTCSTDANIRVFNRIIMGIEGLEYRQYYLGSQVRGDNYDNWSIGFVGADTITGNEVWSPSPTSDNPVAKASGATTPEISMGKIVVMPGASLTIQNMTVKFESDANITVFGNTSTGNGGKLILDGTKLTVLTGNCDNNATMWDGVKLTGISTAPQNSTTASQQPYLSMINNSEISYARTGVEVGKIVYTNPVYVPFFGWLSIPYSTGGGIVKAFNSTFSNNHNGVTFAPYNNFLAYSGITLNNISHFGQCKFTTNDPVTIPDYDVKHLGGTSVRGISVSGCEFENNNTDPNIHSVGIWSNNMGVIVDGVSLPPAYTTVIPSKFTNLMAGIDLYSTSTAYTLTVRNSEFHNNTVGIDLKNAVAPVIAGNKFFVPYVTSALAPSFPPPYAVATTPTIGLAMYGCNAYSVYSNKFQVNSSSGIPPAIPFSDDRTRTVTGILVWNNMDGTDQLINNNTFGGLGVANLSNYKNRTGVTGLWYKCNSQTNNRYDIASLGQNVSGDPNTWDGMRERQGYQVGHPYYASGLPASNTFSSGASSYNLYNVNSECYPIDYYYATSSGGTPLNEPGAAGTTGSIYDYSITKNLLSFDNGCPIPGANWNTTTKTANFILAAGNGPISLNPNMGTDQVLMAVNNNINYYTMNDSGIQHRDSLYYWLNVIKTPANDMSTAYLLLDDSLIDSAYAVYDNIVITDSLTGVDSLNYAYWGKRIFMIQLKEYIRSGATTITFDSLATSLHSISDSTMWVQQVAEMSDIVSNSKGWPRIKAENLLMAYSPNAFKGIMLSKPDTILYPDIPDSTFINDAAKGVLLVTEFSNGPEYGCQYAELAVGNCSSNREAYVDIRKWIINDNSGIFNGTCDDASGISKGYFRLKNDDMWSHVPVGSVIVLYNKDINCYNLPDSFSIDTFAGTYYIPVGAANNHLEQYNGSENNSICSYCSDTGISVFSNGNQWMNVIALDSTLDGIQVVCPGCSPNDTGVPSFYHGVGYGGEEAYDGSISKKPVMFTTNGSNLKFEFIGTSDTDLILREKWAIYTADNVGNAPLSLGTINDTLRSHLVNHDLTFPCCTSQQLQQKSALSHATPNEESNRASLLRVYPNPSTSTVNFEFEHIASGRLKLSDVTGRLVYQTSITNSSMTSVDVKGFTPGIYLFSLTTKDKTITGKILVEK